MQAQVQTSGLEQKCAASTPPRKMAWRACVIDMESRAHGLEAKSDRERVS